QRPELVIHGDDYDTHDGTCVRDYVHVMDLVEAHVLGLEWLLEGKGSRVFNLGTGAGFTVKEVIGHARAATGHKVPHRYGPRRGGDATSLVSGSHAALTELGWDPARSSLKTMIKDAWTWHKTGGYPG
ncbi:NAD-dependent epimerase/dehydratase family protein, partial [Pararhodobacter marinus]